MVVDNSTGAPVVTEVLGSWAEEGDGETGGWGFFSPLEDMVVVVVDGVVAVAVVVFVVVDVDVVVVVIVCGGAAVGGDLVWFNAALLVLGAAAENVVLADPGCDTDAAVVLGATVAAGLKVLTDAVGLLDVLLA